MSRHCPFRLPPFTLCAVNGGSNFLPIGRQGSGSSRGSWFPGGHLLLRVWRGLERQRFHVPLLAGVERYREAAAGVPLQAALTLGAAAALRPLGAAAGLRQVYLRITTNVLRSSSLDGYVRGFLAAMLSAQDVTAIDDATRRAMLQEGTSALAGYVDDDGLAVPAESHVVMAQT